MARRVRKLVLPREGNIAEATGTFEVCALVLVVFIESRLARGLAILGALSAGLISIDAVDLILDWYSE